MDFSDTTFVFLIYEIREHFNLNEGHNTSSSHYQVIKYCHFVKAGIVSEIPTRSPLVSLPWCICPATMLCYADARIRLPVEMFVFSQQTFLHCLVNVGLLRHCVWGIQLGREVKPPIRHQNTGKQRLIPLSLPWFCRGSMPLERKHWADMPSPLLISVTKRSWAMVA